MTAKVSYVCITGTYIRRMGQAISKIFDPTKTYLLINYSREVSIVVNEHTGIDLLTSSPVSDVGESVIPKNKKFPHFFCAGVPTHVLK